MAIRHLLAPIVATEGASATALDAAFVLSKQMGAHVDAVQLLPDASDIRQMWLGEGASPTFVETLIRDRQRDQEARAERGIGLFREACRRHGIEAVDNPTPGVASASYLRENRSRSELGRIGRVADLIVVDQPMMDPAEGRFGFEETLLETGRPFLIIPRGWPPARIGTTIAIGWNGSLEAARAVANAIDLLERSERVAILTVKERTDFQPDARALQRHLALHGCTADIIEGGRGHAAGEMLLAEATAQGADLLVMGAYGRSRLREFLLGGATRHVLGATTLPVLMMH